MASERPEPEALSRSRTSPVADTQHHSPGKNGHNSLQRLITDVITDLSRLEVLTVSDVLRTKLAAQREALSQILQDNQGNLSKIMQAELAHQSNVVSRVIQHQHHKLKEKLRKVVTGDETKSVRAHVRAKRQEPTIVKLIDKLSFTFGVINIAVCEYFVTNQPDYFWAFYTVVMCLMLLARAFRFHAIKYHYFMLDFCYFTQLLCLLNIYLFPWSQTFTKVVFIFANGPLSWAVPVWRNSLVFHDMDKLTTVYIHVLPNMLTYCTRWPQNGQEPLIFGDFLWALLGYLVWQLLYFIKTEINDKAKLDADPEIQTSLRFLTMDRHNPMHQMVRQLMVQIGVMKKGESFDHSTLKTKVIFMSSQLAYTAVTFLPIPWLYNNQSRHLYFVIFVFVIAIYNGASFYIEVFSKRYAKQFEKRQEMQAVAEAAARLALETAAAIPETEAAVQPSVLPANEESVQTEGDVAVQDGESAAADDQLPPPPPPQLPAQTPGISEDTKRLIQAATTEMIDRIMEERDELGAFRTQRMLDGIHPHPPGMLSDVMGVLGFHGMDYFDDSTSSSEGSVTSSQSGTLPASRSCPDLQFYTNKDEPEQQSPPPPRRPVATKSLGAVPTLRKRSVHRDT